MFIPEESTEYDDSDQFRENDEIDEQEDFERYCNDELESYGGQWDATTED